MVGYNVTNDSKRRMSPDQHDLDSGYALLYMLEEGSGQERKWILENILVVYRIADSHNAMLNEDSGIYDEWNHEITDCSLSIFPCCPFPTPKMRDLDNCFLQSHFLSDVPLARSPT
jgi:hypothetical protein